MKEKKAVIIGSLNYDIILKQKRLPKIGETFVADSITMCGGGKGANQAVQLSKLGGKAFMAGCVGNDKFGEELLSNLQKHNVNTDNVKLSEKNNTGMGIVNVFDDGKLIATITRGANYDITNSDIDKIKNEIISAQIIILQMEIPIEVIEYVINLASKHDVYIILNAAPACEIKEEVLSKVNCLVVNETEASFYLNKEINDVKSSIENCEELYGKIKDLLIITLGENGSLLYDGKEKLHIKARKAEVTETTGAGDSFIGAFAYKLLNDSSYKEAAEFASLVSSITVTKIGAQDSMPTYEEVKKFL
ncbi:Ribokinase [Sebaldella termitidis]|jgi:ribokinase|uniref:Ribokinase n=1 Tax=Sebaldella termitidis (strain ATCC 33386 / NCTC 11300) TaxID=526218 RepID=D1AKZ5_SEBTE|nr:ribokinase [Sebaldella termitidis]ACZ07161.1 PfkB domain protein [Sebaldella termitidis ATCC 33386]SUI22452.1 Ribokinase [Sebaldella termitidis]